MLATAISLFFVPWLLLIAWLQPLPTSLQSQLDLASDYGFDGAIAYIEQNGQKPITLTTGWHNREAKIPTRPDALFKIASIAKLYDAVIVSKLVADKTLSLDKTLAEYTPEYASYIQNADQITLRHLVQHRSGIPDLMYTPNYFDNSTNNVSPRARAHSKHTT